MTLTRSTGNSAADFTDQAAMVAAGSPNGRILKLLTGERFSVDLSNAGNGVALSSGNFANPIVDANSVTVITHTGGGLLTALRTNELQDGDTYTLPLAETTKPNQQIKIDLPSTFGAFAPSVLASGSDNITDINGNDTDISFAGPTMITLTSDGSSVWRL